ncbi:MAG: ParA family protein [Anaerolineae bacterium]|nr:ParA family protein [Anaerolineae bacterium]
MARVYAFANQKGGVGKTTSAVNLADALAMRRQRTLLIDLDPQANATSSLGFDKQTVPASVYQVLLHDTPLRDVVQLTDRVHLDLAPSSPTLASAEVELVPQIGREYRLREALAPARDGYDYILIDCPPSLGLLTVNALAAADGVIIPVQCEYLPLEGLAMLMQTIDLAKRRLNPGLTVHGVVMTMYDGRTNLAQQVVAEVRQHFGGQLFSTIIPRNVRLSEAPSFGRTIFQYAPASPGGVAYSHLADELLARDGVVQPTAPVAS